MTSRSTRLVLSLTLLALASSSTFAVDADCFSYTLIASSSSAHDPELPSSSISDSVLSCAADISSPSVPPLKPDYTLGLPLEHYRMKKDKHESRLNAAKAKDDLKGIKREKKRLKHYIRRIRAIENLSFTDAFIIANYHFKKIFPKEEDIPFEEIASWLLNDPDRPPRNKHELKGRAWFNAAYDMIDRQIAERPEESQMIGELYNLQLSQPPGTVTNDDPRQSFHDYASLHQYGEAP